MMVGIIIYGVIGLFCIIMAICRNRARSGIYPKKKQAVADIIADGIQDLLLLIALLIAWPFFIIQMRKDDIS